MARSPLILGGNLTRLDDFTRSLITNRDVIAIDQTAAASQQIAGDPAGAARLRIWTATTGGAHPVRYLAVFNLQESPLRQDLPWPAELGANPVLYDLWNHQRTAGAPALHVDVPPHGCALFRVE